MAIILGVPQIDHSTVSVSVDAGGAHKFLKSGILWADYGDLDISDVDPALLIVPALGAVLPVVYATGIPVVVDSVDLEFADAAASLAPLWRAMYPTFAPSTCFELRGTRISSTRNASAQGDLLLYSGGVDSVTSLLRNKNSVRALLSVWGADIPLENVTVWQQLTELTARSALTRDIRRIAVRTNSRDFVKHYRVVHDFIAPSGDWWGMAEHGLTLLSLCAPATAALGLAQVLIASTHTAAFGEPWGSSPTTDNLVRWTGTTVRHDSFELSRQEKLARHIVPYLEAGGRLDLAVCYQPVRGAVGVNCGRCEKCLRTATGLLAAGGTPADAGLHVAPGGYHSWRSQLLDGELTVANARFQWQDLQRGVPSNPAQRDPDIRAYLDWLRNLDLVNWPADPVHRKYGKAELRFQLRRAADQLPESSQQLLRRLLAKMSSRARSKV